MDATNSDATAEAAAEVAGVAAKAVGAAGAPPSETSAPFMTAGQLATLLLQARGPILDRLGRAVQKFDGCGTADVAQWLDDFERRCSVEGADPCDYVEFCLDGNALRVLRTMTVQESRQWPVVRDRLTAQFGMPEQIAYRSFVERKMSFEEPIDVFIDDLARYGARFGVRTEDKVFRVAFLEGLPREVYRWAVTLQDVYTCGFSDIVDKVRRRLASFPRPQKGAAAVAAVTTGNSTSCYRCKGPHLVSKCPKKRPSGPPKERPCFRCKKQGHFVRDCPLPPPAPGASAGFALEEDGRGASSSSMEL